MTRSILLVLASLASTAAAQNVARPQAADPQAATPVLQYRSPFEGYQPYREPELASWREVSEQLGSVGRHQHQLPQAAEGQSAPKPGGQKPPAAGHGAHGAHR